MVREPITNKCIKKHWANKKVRASLSVKKWPVQKLKNTIECMFIYNSVTMSRIFNDYIAAFIWRCMALHTVKSVVYINQRVQKKNKITNRSTIYSIMRREEHHQLKKGLRMCNDNENDYTLSTQHIKQNSLAFLSFLPFFNRAGGLTSICLITVH